MLLASSYTSPCHTSPERIELHLQHHLVQIAPAMQLQKVPCTKEKERLEVHQCTIAQTHRPKLTTTSQNQRPSHWRRAPGT
jgi:hypothetical protein